MSTSPKLRVALADDSAVFRTVLKRVLGRMDQVELVGTSTNGQQAIDLVGREKPDLLLLDMQMPVLRGAQVLERLKEEGSETGVIVISASDPRAGGETVRLLRNGAFDFIVKPRGGGGINAVDVLHERLDQAVRAFQARLAWNQQLRSRRAADGGIAGGTTEPALFTEIRDRQEDPAPPLLAHPSAISSGASTTPSLQSGSTLSRSGIQIVAIAVSTGGPSALGKVLPLLSADLPVPVVIVQHMPAMFTEHLAQSMNRECPLDVEEAREGEALTPGMVRIARGDFHMRLARRAGRVTCHLDQGPKVNSCRPAADPLFETVADIYGEQALCVVMTGVGADGLAGAAPAAAACAGLGTGRCDPCAGCDRLAVGGRPHRGVLPIPYLAVSRRP